MLTALQSIAVSHFLLSASASQITQLSRRGSYSCHSAIVFQHTSYARCCSMYCGYGCEKNKFSLYSHGVYSQAGKIVLKQIYMMVNLICQLSQAMMSSCLVKHQPRYYYEGFIKMWLKFNSVYFKLGRFPSILWVGLIQ